MELREIISEFINLRIWSDIETVFTILGVAGVALSAVRFFYNLRLREWSGDVTVTVYPPDYDPEMDKKWTIESITMLGPHEEVCGDYTAYTNVTLFEPRGAVIKKLKLIELDTDGREVKTVEVFKNIIPETAVCFRISHGECCAPYKLRWYMKYGDYGEYYFQYNMINGHNDIEGVCCKKTVWSLVRRAIGFQ